MDEASSLIHIVHQDEMRSARAESPARGDDSAAGAQATPPDLGSDSAIPVSDDFGAEDLDHLSAPEERLYIAMARAVVSCL
jgi:hypothetical protein